MKEESLFDNIVGWSLAPCPVCGESVSGEAVFDPDTEQVYHPACVGVVVPKLELAVWCTCTNVVGAGKCPTCGGELCPF